MKTKLCKTCGHRFTINKPEENCFSCEFIESALRSSFQGINCYLDTNNSIAYKSKEFWNKRMDHLLNTK